MGITLRVATYHLGEAIGELALLLRNDMSDRGSDHDSSLGRGRMIHALQHLNWYWNAATDLAGNDENSAEESFTKFSNFPAKIVSTYKQGSSQNTAISDLWPQSGGNLAEDSSVNGSSESDILSIIVLITEELLILSMSGSNAVVRRDDTKVMLRMYGLAFRFWIREFVPDQTARDDSNSSEEARSLIPSELFESVPVPISQKRG